jgi:hypothetical protein
MGVNWLADLHHPDRPAGGGLSPFSRGGNWWSWAVAARWAPDRRHQRPDPGMVADAVQALVKEG